MREIILFLLFFGFSAQAKSQQAEDSIKAVVHGLFNAMKAADSAKIISLFSENAVLQTVGRYNEGLTIVKDEQVSNFGASVAAAKPGDLDEWATIEVLKIDGDLAMVWTPYNFYYKGHFLHCGVNSFQLVRLGGQWKIQYLIDTRRKAPCKPL